ncbi:MAG TPA: hypothetical protein VGL71_08505 [Urbifossiella sp.]
MKKLALAAFVLGILGLVGGVQAEDKKANPTGTWKWMAGKAKREAVGKFEFKDGKLTGTVSAGKMDSKLEDASFKDGKIAFSLSREINGNKITIKYTGTVEGDEIKGKMTGNFNGKEFSTDWEAKREKKTKE